MEVNNVSREQLLKKVQSYCLAAFDIGLYLDTHPNDKRALEMHKDLSEKAMTARMEFQEKFGPLTMGMSRNTETWDWIDDPWPWEQEVK